MARLSSTMLPPPIDTQNDPYFKAQTTTQDRLNWLRDKTRLMPSDDGNPFFSRRFAIHTASRKLSQIPVSSGQGKTRKAETILVSDLLLQNGDHSLASDLLQECFLASAEMIWRGHVPEDKLKSYAMWGHRRGIHQFWVKYLRQQDDFPDSDDWSSWLAHKNPMYQVESRETIERVTSCLNQREREVLCRWAGVLGFPGETLQDIADDLGFTRQRAQQITKRAMDRIRSCVPRKEIEGTMW